VDSPPSSRQLAQALKWRRADGGELKNLFNTSGELYREMKIADRLKAGLSESEALDLLAQHGKLIKRPLVLGADWALVGFREEVWTKHFDKIGSAKRG
jgi:arsenate reductase